MVSLKHVMAEEDVADEDILFIRFDTEMPVIHGGAALVHWRLGTNGKDGLARLATADVGRLAHTLYSTDTLMNNTRARELVYGDVRALMESARLIVTYRWKAVRGFDQYQCLASLFDSGKECPPFAPWPVLDIFDLEKLWLGGKRIEYSDLDSAIVGLNGKAAGGPFTGTVSNIVSRIWGHYYDLKGSRQMMWGLVEAFKKQCEDADMFDKVTGGT